MPVIMWTKAKRNALEKTYHKAIENGASRNDTFMFEGNEYLIAYTEYLLQYLDIADPE